MRENFSLRELCISMTDKVLYDITPFTLLDYPEHLAAIFWFAKCQMRCLYCYNRDMVLGEGRLSEDKAIAFLQSRQGLLEGVVLSGGEATLHDGLVNFAAKIKRLGFKIKLDTNGLNPAMVKSLIENSLVDYIALDYKAPKEKFLSITRDKHFNIFSQTLNYLIASEFPFEVRTTVHSDLLRAEDINRIIHDLHRRGYKGVYYLQHFLYTDTHLGRVKKEKNLFESEKLSNKIPVAWRE